MKSYYLRRPVAIPNTFWIAVEIAFVIALVLFTLWVKTRNDVLMDVSMWACLLLAPLIIWDFIYTVKKKTGRAVFVAPLFFFALLFLGMMAFFAFVPMFRGIPG